MHQFEDTCHNSRHWCVNIVSKYVYRGSHVLFLGVLSNHVVTAERQEWLSVFRNIMRMALALRESNPDPDGTTKVTTGRLSYSSPTIGTCNKQVLLFQLLSSVHFLLLSSPSCIRLTTCLCLNQYTLISHCSLHCTVAYHAHYANVI